MLLTIYLIGVLICFLGMLSIYVGSQQWKQYDEEDGFAEFVTDILAFVIGFILSWALILVIGAAYLYFEVILKYIHKKKL